MNMNHLEIVLPTQNDLLSQVQIHICGTLEDGKNIINHFNLESVAHIDFLPLPAGQISSPAPPDGDISGVERLWEEKYLGVDGEELIGEVIQNPDRLQGLRLHGKAYNHETFRQLAFGSARWDVDACLYSFDTQPEDEDLAVIGRLALNGNVHVLCRMSGNVEERMLSLLMAFPRPIKICRWKEGETKGLRA